MTRDEFIEWLKANVPADAVVLVPRVELGLKPTTSFERLVENDCDVISSDGGQAKVFIGSFWQ